MSADHTGDLPDGVVVLNTAEELLDAAPFWELHRVRYTDGEDACALQPCSIEGVDDHRLPKDIPVNEYLEDARECAYTSQKEEATYTAVATAYDNNLFGGAARYLDALVLDAQVNLKACTGL